MAPTRTRKRKSGQSITSSVDPKTRTPVRSPIKRRKMNISIAQKQALIDNLQLELTERARRLRAQYNVQAQQLRSRVEMRVNRIPSALRKAKMGEILEKHTEPQPSRATFAAKPPPVPAKDSTPSKPVPRKLVGASDPRRVNKRLSDEITSYDDKENSAEPVGQPKKKLRGGPAEAAHLHPGQVLSPASTNTRIVHRTMERPPSPAKSMMPRPISPMKSSANLLSSMVEKAKGSRGGASTRKMNTTGSSASGTATRPRKPAVPTAATTASTRGSRKISETSESSTGTVVKKSTASRATVAKTAPVKRTVMSTIKSATTKKTPSSKPAPAPATTGRSLRSKRQA